MIKTKRMRGVCRFAPKGKGSLPTESNGYHKSNVRILTGATKCFGNSTNGSFSLAKKKLAILSESRALKRAADGGRTRDIRLGKATLYH